MASAVSQAAVLPRSTRGFGVGGVGGQVVTECTDGVGRAVLPPVLGSVELQGGSCRCSEASNLQPAQIT